MSMIEHVKKNNLGLQLHSAEIHGKYLRDGLMVGEYKRCLYVDVGECWRFFTSRGSSDRVASTGMY